MWFYAGGKRWREKRAGAVEGAAEVQRIYSFEHDDDYIYSAFLTQYHIDLQDIEYLHWWKFKAMFDALRPDCLFSKIVEWRSTDLTQVKDPKEKKFIQEMKQVYRLRKSVDEQEKLDLIADALMSGGDLSKL